MAEQIIIELVTDTGQVEGAIPTLQKIQKLSNEDAAAYANLQKKSSTALQTTITEGTKAGKTLQDLQKSIGAVATAFEKGFEAEVKSSFAKAGVSVANFRKELGTLGKTSAFDDLRNKIDATNKKLLETAARMESLSRRGLGDSEQYKKLEKTLATSKHEADRLAQSMDNVKATVTGFANTSKDAGTKVTSMRGEIRKTTEELARMFAAGELTAAQIYDMARSAGSLKESMDDARQAVSVLAQDSTELTFDATIKGVQLFAAGAQGLMGVQALLGAENEDLQKTLVKLNAVMAITQSLKEIKILLEKQDTLALVQNIAVTKAQGVANTITTATFAAFGASVATTSTAFKVLRTAIITTGIGALIVGVGMLVSKIIEWTEETKTQAEVQDELNQKLEEYREKLEKTFNESAAEKARQNRLKGIERELKLLEAQGNKETEILKLQEERADLLKKSSKARASTLEDYTKDVEEEANKQLDIENDIEVARIKAAKDAAEKKKKINEDYSNKARDLAERNAKAEFDLIERNLKRQADAAQKIAGNEGNPWTLRLIALQDYATVSAQLLDKQMAEELRKTDLTEKEKANITAKYEDLSLDNMQQVTEAKNLILINRFKDFEKQIEAIFKAGQAEFSKDLDNELSSLEVVFKMGLLSVKEYEKARNDTQESYAKKFTKNEIKRLEDLIANRKKNNQDTLDLEKQLYEEREKLRQGDLKASQDAADEERKAAEERMADFIHKLELARTSQEATIRLMLNSLNETLPDDVFTKVFNSIAAGYSRIKQSIDEVSAAQEKYKQNLISKSEYERVAAKAQQEYIVTGFATMQEVVNGIFAANKEARAADLQNQLDTLAAQRDAELQNKNLTDAQKVALEKRYQQQTAALKKSAWEKDKAARLSQAIINGLLAVTNALATAPTIVAGIALAGVAAATTGIQVAKIRNEKTPAFKKGTKNAPKGYAWVGEEGPELVHLKGGEKIWTYRQSQKIEDAWRGGSIDKPEDILTGKIAIPDVGLANWASQRKDKSVNIDYKKLAKEIGAEVAQHIPKAEPVTVNNVIDQHGLVLFIQKELSRLEVRNKHYTFKK